VTYLSPIIGALVAAIALLTLLVLIWMAWKLRARFLHLDGQLAALSAEFRKMIDNRVVDRIAEVSVEVQNASALRQLDFKSPLFLGGWSIDSFLGRTIFDSVLVDRPNCIVELGSGSSTLLIARCLSLIGHGDAEHIAVDHEETYLEQTRSYLALNGLEQHVKLWLCPLSRDDVTGKLWYSGLTQRLEGHKIDLLLIDGPPGTTQEDSRYPALPVLMPFLSDRCTIMLDDARRPAERSIVEQWAAKFPDFDVRFLRDGHGVAILRRRAGRH
jgi:predicted O-methyltransferase YrrM